MVVFKRGQAFCSTVAVPRQRTANVDSRLCSDEAQPRTWKNPPRRRRGSRFNFPRVDHGLIIDIAICIIAAWVMAVVCQGFRQPLLIAYLLAGFAAGPNGFRWVTSPDSIQLIADIGLILLLFMIGLEMDLKTMFNAGRVITVTALVQIVGCVALGWLFFRTT